MSSNNQVEMDKEQAEYLGYMHIHGIEAGRQQSTRDPLPLIILTIHVKDKYIPKFRSSTARVYFYEKGKIPRTSTGTEIISVPVHATHRTLTDEELSPTTELTVQHVPGDNFMFQYHFNRLMATTPGKGYLHIKVQQKKEDQTVQSLITVRTREFKVVAPR